MLSIAGHEKIKLLGKCKSPHIHAQHNDNVQHALCQAIWDRYTRNKTIPPSFQNTGHCPKAPTEPWRKEKRKKDRLQKYTKKQRETEKKNKKKRDLFTLKYEYFHFFSIKKKRPVYTQIQSSIHFQKTAVFVFIIYRNRAFSFLLHLILFPVKITWFYFIFNTASPQNGKCSHFAAEIQA